MKALLEAIRNSLGIVLKSRKTKALNFLWTNGSKIFMKKNKDEGRRVVQITNAKATRTLELTTSRTISALLQGCSDSESEWQKNSQ